MEEQTATTNEMGRTLADAARGTQEIAANIGGVAEAIEQTSGAAQNSQQATPGAGPDGRPARPAGGQFQYEEILVVAGRQVTRPEAARRHGHSPRELSPRGPDRRTPSGSLN